VEPGTLHGLLGENGAGKSTLMKILSGYQPADAGSIRLAGRTLRLGSPRAAVEAGVGMLHQDPLVCLPFPALDNFLLGRPGPVDRRAAAAELAERCDRLGFRLEPDAPTRLLSVGERQQLEIVRLLSLGVKVLILDEPTSGISAEQRTALFGALRTLAAEGLIVIFVSHKLEEVEDLCSQVTVMRRGRVVGEVNLPCPAERLIEMMFAEAVVQSPRPEVPLGPPLLEVNGLSAGSGRHRCRDVSATAAAGEVIGLAGLEGSGQRAFLRACAGLLRPSGGRLSVAGADLTGRSYARMAAAGVHYLPAGRLEEGLVAGLTVSEHLVLAMAQDRRLIDREAARRRAEEAIARFSIRGTPDTAVEDLSGGNQQRTLLALMPPHLRLLLLEHPTRGLDIESADDVWRLILGRREEGTAIVFASSDLDELTTYADRVAVFFDGAIIRILDRADATAEALGLLIGGKT
jgi:simple sugar transport system ATP-binding protein